MFDNFDAVSYGMLITSIAMQLKNKTAIITGSSKGIGKDIALLFAKEGADIVINSSSSSEESLRDLIKEIRDIGRRCIYIRADVSKKPEVDFLVQRTLSELGSINILINNAGISPKKNGRKVPIVELQQEEWDRVFAVNISGVFLCSKAVIPHMMKNKDGRIINISSMDGKTGGFYSVSAHYAASKAAVITFTKTLAREAAPYGINVNCIAPGCIVTGMLLNRPNELLDSYLQHIPLKRFGRTSEIASVALFLASNASSYITGATIDVNGGWIMD